MTDQSALVAADPNPRLDFTSRGTEVVGDGQRGRTVVSDRVVTAIASIASAEVQAITDTRGGWAKVVRKGLPSAEADIRGGQSRIRVDVAAVWPLPLSRVAQQVRRHVHDQVEALTGIPVAAVDVTVAEVVHVEAHEPRVR